MEHLISLNFSKRVSLVVCPIDDFTGERRSGANIRVFLNDPNRKPVRKPYGYYVFTDLTEDSYTLYVQSDIYRDECLEVQMNRLDRANPMVYVTLKPATCYPFLTGATLVRASLRGNDGESVKGAEVTAVMLDEDCAIARIAQEGVEKGATELKIVSPAGRISMGDIFLLKERDGSASEYCRVVDLSGNMQHLKLSGQLKADYGRASLLMPAVKTYTDDRGEFVVYFRNCPCRRFDISLQFKYNDEVSVREVKVEDGKVLNLGIVRV